MEQKELAEPHEVSVAADSDVAPATTPVVLQEYHVRRMTVLAPCAPQAAAVTLTLLGVSLGTSYGRACCFNSNFSGGVPRTSCGRACCCNSICAVTLRGGGSLEKLELQRQLQRRQASGPSSYARGIA